MLRGAGEALYGVGAMLRGLVASGHAVDIVLGVLAIELAWLIGVRRWSRSAAVLRLAPGAVMLLALRAALTGADAYWVVALLALSFPFHLADVLIGGGRGRARHAAMPGSAQGGRIRGGRDQAGRDQGGPIPAAGGTATGSGGTRRRVRWRT